MIEPEYDADDMAEYDAEWWLLDAVATASRHPALNPYSSAYDEVLAQAILDNGRRLEQRAQRAEAECERLREALQAAKPFINECGQPAGGRTAINVNMQVNAALATPPPEGEPERE